MRTTYSKRVLNTSTFGDARLLKRYDLICDQLSTDLSLTIPQACVTKSSTKAMYRFFDNQQVEPEKMIAYHFSQWKESLPSKRLLHIMDTVEYDLTGKRSAESLGPLNYRLRKGMKQHNSLICTDDGLPIGLLKQSYNIRKEEDFGKAAERKKLPIEEKETYCWYDHFLEAQRFCESDPELEIISIADREADIMELFLARTHPRMHFIIRSKHNRKLADKTDNLYPALSKEPFQGTYQISIIHPQTKKERIATLSVRFRKVDIKLEKALPVKRDLSSISLNVVEVVEQNPPKDIKEPIRWVLLTTLDVNSFEEALKIIRLYIKRWLIERFHYLLKSGGAEVEQLQLENSHRLKNAITAYSVAGMKVFKLRYWSEHTPQASIKEIGISEVEYKVLYKYAEQKVDKKIQFDPDTFPSVSEFTVVLGRISGFFPSKRQPIPGIKILSRAITKLNDLVDAYLFLCQ